MGVYRFIFFLYLIAKLVVVFSKLLILLVLRLVVIFIYWYGNVNWDVVSFDFILFRENMFVLRIGILFLMNKVVSEISIFERICVIWGLVNECLE